MARNVLFHNLKQHAVRGVENLQIGGKYLACHVGSIQQNAREIVIVGIMTGHPSVFNVKNDHNMGMAYWRSVDSNGNIRYLSDDGVIPYPSGYNKHNFFLDIAALAEIGIVPVICENKEDVVDDFRLEHDIDEAKMAAFIERYERAK